MPARGQELCHGDGQRQASGGDLVCVGEHRPCLATGRCSERSSNHSSACACASTRKHLKRTSRICAPWSGNREVDLIVERGRQIVALEVKLGQVDDRDVRTSCGRATNSGTTSQTPPSSQPVIDAPR